MVRVVMLVAISFHSSKASRLPHMSPLWWVIHPHPLLALTVITQHSRTSSHLKTLHYWTAH